MKIFSGIIGLIIFVVAVTFAVANRDTASVNLWPFDVKIEAPQCLLTLGALLFGMLIGSGFVWLNMLPHKFMSRRLRKDVAVLHSKLEELQNSLRPHHTDHSLSFLTRPKLRWPFGNKPQ